MKSQLHYVPFILVIACYLISCGEKDDYDTILKNTPVNKEFATNSPVAKSITLLLLDKPNKWGNFRMTADLKGQLQESYLAYEVDKQKIVLRDDGRGADSTKGDGLFSAFVNIDTSDVKTMVSEQNASIARAANAEANLKDVRNIVSFLKFTTKDSTTSQTSHALLLNDPNFSFENRFVTFDKSEAHFFEINSLFKTRLPIVLVPAFLCPAPPADLIPKSLMVNDIHVVEDPTRTWNPVTHTGNKNGAWTFNNIVTQMSNKTATGVSATQFVLNWLQTWDNSINFNGDEAEARPAIDDIINKWKQRSLAHGLPVDTLDMAEAPVKLLAIVNRVDLRNNVGYSSTNAGEGRFVFNVLETSGSSSALQNSPKQFTIIFEFGINKNGCANVQNWGHQWFQLHTKTPGDPSYNADLQAITDQFVNANTDPSKPNGSSLNQVRTDEIALSGPWQLREFNIDATSHLLTLVTVKKTPIDGLNHSAQLANYINSNCASVHANSYNIPAVFNGAPLLGIKSNNTLSNPWNAAITCADADSVRKVISLNTCNACHGVETNTFFTQVSPTSFGSTASLAGFLTGENIHNPVTNAPEAFADLDRRAKDLERLICLPCRVFGPLAFRPVNMVH